MPDKTLIRHELLECVRKKPIEFLYYGDFAPRVNMSTRGPWKSVLDELSRDFSNEKLPDLTFLLKRKDTNYPGQIGFVEARNPTQSQKLLARGKAQEIIDKYNPGQPNPF